jgi:PPK2 family polyphosphate:nucleotide phosphotransferase
MARKSHERIEPYVVTNGNRFRLKNHDPGDRAWIKSKDDAREQMEKGRDQLCVLQEKLFAQDQWGVLLIFQAMDAAGKDGIIKHVMSGVNPAGCEVTSFKSPSAEELDHDYLWRTTKALPQRGRIGIFNRSYYEETLVVRVHPEFLDHQKLPPKLLTQRIWRERFDDINAFERHLTRNGFVIRKFFLNVSRKEQRRRFLERLERPEKNWKFAMGDLGERALWRQYMAAYQETIRHTATPNAPWVIVPADDKKTARVIVVAAVVDAIRAIHPVFPTLDTAHRKELARARRMLQHEGRRIKS